MPEHTPARRRSSAPTPPALRPGPLSGGQALDGPTNARMSAKFGHDFSSVRIHTDRRAEDSAGAAGANAFALGNDVVFGAGQYQPGSPDTERLLAHELTHVVQQAQSGPGGRLAASDRSDASEREARALSERVLRGEPVQVRAAPGAALARDDKDDPPDPPDTPSSREKEKPGGPTDWGDKGGGFTWDGSSILPKSGYLDPGMGDPLQIPMPWGGSDKPQKLKPIPEGLDWGAPPPSPGSKEAPLPGPALPGFGPPALSWPAPTPSPGLVPDLTPPTFGRPSDPLSPAKPPLIGGDLPPLTLAPTPGVLPPVPNVQLTPPSLIAPSDADGS